MIELELPYPPSVNHYYRHVGPRVLISREGRRYREIVSTLVRGKAVEPLQGKIALYAEFYPPDRRRRDLDNVGGKILLDTLQAAKLFEDDCQIKRIHLEMHEPVENGLCFVKLKEITPMFRYQGRTERKKIVNETLDKMPSRRLLRICRLYMDGYSDEEIRNRIGMTPAELDECRAYIRRRLIDAGFAVRGRSE